MRVVFKKSETKKYQACFYDGDKLVKKTDFGAKGMRDYTLINSKASRFYLPTEEEREAVKKAYLRRHSKNEDWNDYMSAGALSRWILWNKPTLQSSITDYKNRFGLK